MSSQSTTFSHDEDFLLCRVYMEVSQDSIVGVNQSVDGFWCRVEASYTKDVPTDWEFRSLRSLQARMKYIEKATMRLHGCIRAILDRHSNSASNENIMRQAKVLFKEDVKFKVGWKLDHVWDLIKEFSKFQDGGKKMRQPRLISASCESEGTTPNNPNASGLSPFSINSNDDDNVFGGSPSERPIGAKKAKLKRKQDGEIFNFIDCMLEENKQLRKEMKMLHVQLDHHLELKEKSIAIKLMKEENKILMRDASFIKDPCIRARLEADQLRVLQIRAQQEDLQDPYATNSMGHEFYNIGGSGSGLGDY